MGLPHLLRPQIRVHPLGRRRSSDARDSKIKNIAKEQAIYGYPSYGISFPNPDFAAYARSCGGEGHRCEIPDELDEALARGMGSDMPVIFDVVVDPEKMALHVISGA
jgi:thiamine pyrophosphate-dependent acetolactate synthase large subunit-like protein